jgi:hypothetical protein
MWLVRSLVRFPFEEVSSEPFGGLRFQSLLG